MRSLLLALVLSLPSRGFAIELPARGLPEGRLSSSPMLAVKPAAPGAFAIMLGGARTFGSALPGGNAGPVAEQAAAAAEAGRRADAAVSALEQAIAEGRAGGEDLALLESDLFALSVYGGRAQERYEEVRRLAADQRERAVARALAKVAFESKPADDSAVLAAAGAGSSRLSKAASHRIGRAATWAGAGLLGASAAAMIHPAIVHGAAELPGILTWAGAASLGLGRLFGPLTARGATQQSAWKLPAWLAKWIESFVVLGRAAQNSAESEMRLEAKVGDGDWDAFKAWVAAGARTALYWLPIALLGMVGSAFLALPFNVYEVVPDHAKTAAIPLFHLINSTASRIVLTELAVLGVVFNGARRLALTRVGDSAAAWIAGALTLGTAFGALLAAGYALPVALKRLGVEVVMILLYVRTKTLLAPGLARVLFALTTVESVRMKAFLKVPAGGDLAGLPDWAGWGVAGLLGAFLLRAPIQAQLARLKDFAAWWSKPTADEPKSPLPMLALGLLWAIPLYLGMEGAFQLVQLLVPQVQPTPEILRRMFLMPVDVILFNFMLMTALEEWVFRRGVFAYIREKIKNWGAPPKWWFWPAAIVSALVFSGMHGIDWGAIMARLGAGDADLGSLLTGGNAFNWANFSARTVAGVILAFLYASSGTLLVPMTAHFGANVVQALGMRWGLWPFLALCAAPLLLQFWRGVKPPAQS